VDSFEPEEALGDARRRDNARQRVPHDGGAAKQDDAQRNKIRGLGLLEFYYGPQWQQPLAQRDSTPRQHDRPNAAHPPRLAEADLTVSGLSS
jgi:hypothetical protein